MMTIGDDAFEYFKRLKADLLSPAFTYQGDHDMPEPRNRRNPRDLTRDRVNDTIKMIGRLEKSALRGEFSPTQVNLIAASLHSRINTMNERLLSSIRGEPKFDWEQPDQFIGSVDCAESDIFPSAGEGNLSPPVERE